MLSSIDVTRLKRYRLWVFIVVGVVLLAMVISWFRPAQKKLKKHVDHSLIEVKYDDDNIQKWTMASELQLKELLDGQAASKKTVEKQAVLINTLQKKENEQSKQLTKLEDKMVRIKMQQLISKRSVSSHSNLSNKRLVKSMDISYPPTVRHLKDRFLTKKKPINNFLGWLPMGSFFRATLLNGVEAGTGSNAEANPQPVLMRVTDNAILPNIYRYQLASCFILGSAYGSLSSERAFIRTVEISCVGHNGRAVITAPIKGFIVDSDGKIGLRGLLVNRQGEKLGRAMLSGFFAGLSGVGGQAQGTSATGSLGMANMLSAGASLRMAGFNGVSNATNELAQFYIGEAKRLFPVIEVSAGRAVTINLSQGVSLQWQFVTKQPLREEGASLL